MLAERELCFDSDSRPALRHSGDLLRPRRHHGRTRRLLLPPRGPRRSRSTPPGRSPQLFAPRHRSGAGQRPYPGAAAGGLRDLRSRRLHRRARRRGRLESRPRAAPCCAGPCPTSRRDPAGARRGVPAPVRLAAWSSTIALARRARARRHAARARPTCTKVHRLAAEQAGAGWLRLHDNGLLPPRPTRASTSTSCTSTTWSRTASTRAAPSPMTCHGAVCVRSRPLPSATVRATW